MPPIFGEGPRKRASRKWAVPKRHEQFNAVLTQFNVSLHWRRNTVLTQFNVSLQSQMFHVLAAV